MTTLNDARVSGDYKILEYSCSTAAGDATCKYHLQLAGAVHAY